MQSLWSRSLLFRNSSEHGLTQGRICWEDCGIVLTHTWMLQTTTKPKPLLFRKVVTLADDILVSIKVWLNDCSWLLVILLIATEALRVYLIFHRTAKTPIRLFSPHMTVTSFVETCRPCKPKTKTKAFPVSIYTKIITYRVHKWTNHYPLLSS